MDEKAPTTLLEAIRAFADPQVAHDYFARLRFPNGVACPRPGCGSANIAPIKKRNAWRCRECKRHFSVKVGTMFEDSPIGFDKWLPAMWLLSANRNGISSCELARGLGVTQKTAWFMLHRLRYAMKTTTFEKLSGEVEVDETYFGARPRHRIPRAAMMGGKYEKPLKTYKKPAVMGFRERGGKVRAFVVPDTRVLTLYMRLRDNVEAGSTRYSDAHVGYNTPAARRYRHFVINHSVEYVRGHVHTNNIENFWSVLKRTIGGTYICPRPQPLAASLDEHISRFN